MLPPSTDLVAPPGYSPTVGALVAMLTYTRASTIAAVDALTVADLDHQHDATANPIGVLLAHIGAIEWSLLTWTLEGAQPAPQEWGEFGPLIRLGPDAWAAARGRSLDELLARLASLRERTLAGLQRVDDAWLTNHASLPWMPNPTTNLWTWYHVMEDELNHRGQIRWLRSRLPSVVAAHGVRGADSD